MGKPVTKPQFDAMLERRVNTIANTVKDQIGTTDNNPQHLDADTADKVIAYLEGVIAALKNNFETALTRSAPATITEFSLGKKSVKAAAKAGSKTAVKSEALDREFVEDLKKTGALRTGGTAVKPAEKPPILINWEEEAADDETDLTPYAEPVKPKKTKAEPKTAPKPAPVVEDVDDDELDGLDELLKD